MKGCRLGQRKGTDKLSVSGQEIEKRLKPVEETLEERVTVFNQLSVS